MVLSIFDQTRRDENDNRLLKIDDSAYSSDSEMEHILHRLTMAAADADMRHKMNVEDEYFGAIERRDTDILIRDKKIAEQKAQLSEQKAQLSEQNMMLRSMAKLLLDSGLRPEDIAKKLNTDLPMVIELLRD